MPNAAASEARVRRCDRGFIFTAVPFLLRVDVDGTGIKNDLQSVTRSEGGKKRPALLLRSVGGG